MSKLVIDSDQVDVKGKKVLMRVDFNVPLENGVITDDNRIKQALPSIEYLAEKGALVILTSHLGRPKGERDPKLSLKPVADYLTDHVPYNVYFAEDCIGKKAETVINKADFGDIVLLENVRFHPEEKQNDKAFSKQLAAHADLFVNDAFGSSHRAHASVVGVAEFLKPAVSGFLLEKEIEYLENTINNPGHPFVAILGGAKVSDKIGVIENLLTKVDAIIIGGGMTYTFMRAQGKPTGDSLVEEDKIDLAADLLKKAEKAGITIYLPVDHIVADEFKNEAEHKVVGENGIEEGWLAVDIGPETAISYGNIIKKAQTVVWNGPMGVFEMENFAEGTFAVAEALAEATAQGATTIIGGGDSASAIKKAGLEEKVSHVSTGGGASLEYLEGNILPGVAALTDA